MITDLLLHTCLGLLLLLIPAGLLYLLERPMLKKLGITILRMMIQLALLCLLVWALIKANSPGLMIIWLLAISVYSGWIVMQRCKIPEALEVKLMLLVSVGLLIAVSLVGCWLLGLVFAVPVFTAHWFIPLTALLMGHAMTMLIRGLSTYLSALQTDTEQIEFLQGNGVSPFKALLPFYRRSLLAILSPTMANLTVLGLTSMPLLLIGLFMGGFSPIRAWILMFGMVVGCVVTSVLALTLSIWFYELSQRHHRHPTA